MASIFKPTFTKTDANTGLKRKCKTKNWYVKYRDENGIVRRVPGFTDKEATKQLAARLEKQAARKETGLIDKFEEHRKRPLAEHVEDYRRYLVSKENTKEHVQVTCARISRINEACAFGRIADISQSRVENWLSEQRKAGEFSAQTSSYYATAAKGFCRWLVRDRRTAENMLAHLAGVNAKKTDVQIERRALGESDFAALILAAGKGQPFHGLTGVDRTMLYLTAAYTGLRASELQSLTPASFDLRGDNPAVTVAAASSKRRLLDTQPLRADLAAKLCDWLAGKPANAKVWPGTWHKKAAKMLRGDLEAAEVPFADEAGRVFDFHAFRH